MIYRLNAKKKIQDAIKERLGTENECEMTDEEISRITGFSPKTVRKYIYVLSEQGFFDVHRGSGKKSLYRRLQEKGGYDD